MNLCGIDINCNCIWDLLNKKEFGNILVTVNSEAIVRSQTDLKLAKIIAENYASIDGQIPLWLFKFRYPNSPIIKISGSDVIYPLCEWAADNSKKVFLLGGKSDSNIKAIEKLRNLFPNLKIDGYSPEYAPYPFDMILNHEILSEIKSFSPYILFVGFGMGKQEYWAYDNIQVLKSIGIKLIIGCGGTFEFVSGNIKRAPKLIQRIGMEGVYRLFQEFKWFRFKRLLMSFGIFYYFLFPKKEPKS